MTGRRPRAATALALAVVVLGVAACGPAGELAPTTAPPPDPTATATATAIEPTPSEPTPGPTSAPSPTPASPVSPPAAPRTPPTVPPLPETAIDATDVPTIGPEPAYGSRYDYLVLCDPPIPMWLDDGDGRRTWDSTDREVECEVGQLARIAMSVRYEESRLLTFYEEDIGLPSVFRTPTLTGFGADAIAAVAEQGGVQEVDMEISCSSEFVGYVDVGGRYAYCSDAFSARLTDVPLADALASANVVSPLQMFMTLYPS